MFVVFSTGLSIKKIEIRDNCMKYHDMLTEKDARETCSDIMTGDKYASIARGEATVPENDPSRVGVEIK